LVVLTDCYNRGWRRNWHSGVGGRTDLWEYAYIKLEAGFSFFYNELPTITLIGILVVENARPIGFIDYDRTLLGYVKSHSREKDEYTQKPKESWHRCQNAFRRKIYTEKLSC